jgi:hypothetical protein
VSHLVVIEHGERSHGRRLHRSRVRLALAIAALEGIAVLAGAVPWWVVVLLALAALGTWGAAGRMHANAVVRDLSWVFAVSQLLVVLVPVATAIIVALAVVVLVVFAVAALVALFLDRR